MSTEVVGQNPLAVMPGEDVSAGRNHYGFDNGWQPCRKAKSIRIRTDLSTYDMRSKCGRNSAVECQLPKLDVVGSIPIARYIEQ